jgi:hypothetical protein
MNKKKLLFIALALVLVMTVLMPSAAFAKNNQYQSMSAYTDFTGSGFVYVYSVGDIIPEGNTVKFYEEVVPGALIGCTWKELEGAEFWSTHDSTVWVDQYGNACGFMRGKFLLTSTVAEGTISGTFQGKITGNLGDMATGDITNTKISDTGTWRCTRGTGVFEGVEAWGEWSAGLQAGLIPGTDIPSLVGNLVWNGKYSSGDTNKWEKWGNKKPGKPEKSWKSKSWKSGKSWNWGSAKPGTPFKGWKNSD